MTRLARTLLYRRRYPRLHHTTLPLGLGALMVRTNRLTGRHAYLWRWADDTVWLSLRPGGVDELPRCRTRAEVERLLAGGVR
jgi:hypothetical protein